MSRSVWRALHSLAHPFSIGAVIVLLINDHYLRYEFPSWWTGKIGDAAWLIFAPLIAALLFALILPEKHVGIAAFGFIGIWFATAKTLAPIHAFTLDLWGWMIGSEPSLRQDMTDLTMLPALLVSWYIWQQASVDHLKLQPHAWVIFTLGIVGSLASDYPQLYGTPGVTCFFEKDNVLIFAEYDIQVPYTERTYPVKVYSSIDGGLNWEQTLLDDAEVSYVNPNCKSQRGVLIDPIDNQVQYRTQYNIAIERSVDGGKTWHIDYDLQHLNTEFSNYYYRTHFKYGLDGYYAYYPDLPLVPLDMKYDLATQNVIFAMGWYGVLVREPNGHYQWADVGQYKLFDLDSNKRFPLIKYTYIGAGVLAGLILASLGTYINLGRWLRFEVFLLGLAWLLWVALIRLISPLILPSSELIADDDSVDSFLDLFCGLPIAFIMALAVLVNMSLYLLPLWNTNRRLLRQTCTYSLLTAGLFLLPYLLWAYGRIEVYNTAKTLSLILTAGGVATSFAVLRRFLNNSSEKTEAPL